MCFQFPRPDAVVCTEQQHPEQRLASTRNILDGQLMFQVTYFNFFSLLTSLIFRRAGNKQRLPPRLIQQPPSATPSDVQPGRKAAG
jgi:hypothetical protein